MRSPVEILVTQHKKAYRVADALLELLAPDDIQNHLIDPARNKLRADIHSRLKEIADFVDSHFIFEETVLIPAIIDYLERNKLDADDALGCLHREHAQMHMFIGRLKEILAVLESGKPPDASEAAEIIRISYGIQSVIRHHCTKEERDIYPLVEKLPPKVAAKITEQLGAHDDIALDHLVKPLGNEVKGRIKPAGMDSPEN